MTDETRFQSLRQLSTGQVFQVEAYYHPDSRQHIVLWDDLTQAFPRLNTVRDGTAVIPRARDNTKHYIEPRCIKYHPDRVLNADDSEK